MIKDRINLLFVDDDEDDFIIIQDFLSELPNQKYVLDWAPSYSSALKGIKEKKHDVYLVDYRLGEDTGISLIKKARELGNDQPFIILTGKGDRQIDFEAMKQGAADYLVKDKIDSYSLERTIRYAIERKLAVEAIKESEKKYRNIFEQSKDIIFITNKDGLFIDVNDSASAILGYSKKEMHSISIFDLFESKEESESFRSTLQSRNEVQDFESVLINKDLKKINALITLTVQNEPDQESTFYQGIIHDITLRKKSEQEILAAEKLSVTGRIARTIAHEVRNPLTNVNLALEQLIHEVDIEPVDKEATGTYFDIIKRNCDRINQLITELLNSSKPSELRFTPYPVNNIIDETLDLAKDRINLKQIKIEKNYTQTQGKKVFIDPEKIKIALLNIFINAVEAMEPQQGVLKVTNETKGNKCLISISDNGTGISRENLKRLFDPFYTGKGNGMGLGLTTTQSIVMNHKGSINVESEPGKGTTFTISLEGQENA